MKHTAKHTAANTPLLATIKHIFNTMIYKTALATYNTDGEEAALAYLQQFVITDIRLELGVI